MECTEQTNDDEVEVMEEVELSSDEEENDEVSLIVLKRPPAIKRIVHDVEVVEPSNRPEAGNSNFTSKEYRGFVKEFIEQEGLALLLSKELGVVLFHLDSVWIDGHLINDRRKVKSEISAGTDVDFLVRSFHGEDYKSISDEKVLHQAVAVWIGRRPSQMLKVATGEESTRRLEENRKSFMLYIREEVFTRASLVRVLGEVAGYLSDEFGILEYKDENNSKLNILFHTDDVKIFRKDVRSLRKPLKTALPVGCLVSVDARSVYIAGVKNVQYQALAVLAGDWPSTPHPTLFPGGKGSKAPKYELPPGDFTFYYLELALESRLQRRVDRLKNILSGSKGSISYDWRGVDYINNKDDFIEWKYKMGGRVGGKKNPDHGKPREVLDSFRASFVTEEEMAVRSVVKEIESRTWYSPEAWEHGGLRLKAEVKNEESSEPAAKKVRRS